MSADHKLLGTDQEKRKKPQPARADTGAARELAAVWDDRAKYGQSRTNELACTEAADTIRALADDLDNTRASYERSVDDLLRQRNEARAELARVRAFAAEMDANREVALQGGVRARDELARVRAALPPSDTLWNAALLLRDYGSGAAVGMAGDLEHRSDAIRALDLDTAPVAVDVPGFLRGRVTG